MPMVGYGAMVVESLLGIVSLVVVGAVAVNGTKPDGTPFSIFSSGVAGFLEKLGVPVTVATVFMTMCVSALALTSLDSVARIGRMSFQELFYGDSTDPADMTPVQRVLTNKYFATVITLIFWIFTDTRRIQQRMAIVRLCKPVTCSTCINRLSCFLKNNRSYRMDTLHSNVCYAGSYVHCPDPENGCPCRQLHER